MKLSFPLLRLAATCILAATTATLASAFEGKIEMKMTSSQSKEEMPTTYFLKGTHMRMEMATPPDKHNKEGGKFAVIINMETRESIMLMDKDKMYMVNKIPEPSAEKTAEKSSAPEFKPTGRKEKIAGYDAEEYVGISGKKYIEMWVTKEFGKVIMANQGKGGPMGGKPKDSASAWQKFAEQNDFFALRTIIRAKEGGPEEMRMEVTKIDKGPLADSLFLPPADYQKFEMPSMGDMMKGMIPGR